MPKFSIIIPVYNVEKYIKRCLDSVINQSYNNYEIIVVDDGCTDNSIKIAKNYPAKIISNKHVSVSEARNIGVKHAKGEYLLFLDSDDYWDKRLLENIINSMNNDPDLIRFQVRTVTDQNEITNYNEISFQNKNGPEAFKLISNFHFVESVWCYAIKRNYYFREKFEFKKGMVHEDFGLTPLLIIKAKKVNSIGYIGYNYFRRKGSIMNNPDYEWIKIKVRDFYNHYKNLIEEIDKTNIDSKLFKSFIANSLILKICELNKKEYKQYKNKLKKDKVYENLLTDTLPRKIKKIIIKISPKMFYMFFKR